MVFALGMVFGFVLLVVSSLVTEQSKVCKNGLGTARDVLCSLGGLELSLFEPTDILYF